MSLREIDITKFRESDNNTRCNEAMEIDKGNLAATKCVAIEGVKEICRVRKKMNERRITEQEDRRRQREGEDKNLPDAGW